jgi:D-arabinan exo alpha-(1,3)/(1,5)-arabinofuranosidase (non-reducing end)
MWSANPGGRLWRIYIDGAHEPEIEFEGKDLLGGKVDEWGAAFSERRAMGANFIFPIPFSKSVKVTVAHRDEKKGAKAPMMYYHVDLLLFTEDTEVRPFSMDEMKSLKNKIDETASIISNPDNMKIPADEKHELEISLASGASGELIKLNGQKAIRKIEFKIKSGPGALDEILGKTIFQIKWDDEKENSVNVPLGDFFGTSPGANDMQSLPFSVQATGDGAVLTCRWVMPFQENAVITFVNQSSKRLNLEAQIIAGPWDWGDDSLYFNAGWRESNDIKTRPWTDMRMVSVKGKGNFVGLQQNVRNPMEYFWWGEGDEKIYVDGEDFPSIFGTGTEDYFGYAWCVQYIKFTHAYHGVSLPTKEPLIAAQAVAIPFMWEAISNATSQQALVSQYRWHILDVIPFDESFVFDMEIWHHRNTSVDVNATAYWYADENSTSDAKTPDLSKREVWQK